MKLKNNTRINSKSLDEYLLYDNVNVDEYDDVFNYEKELEPLKMIIPYINVIIPKQYLVICLIVIYRRVLRLIIFPGS